MQELTGTVSSTTSHPVRATAETGIVSLHRRKDENVVKIEVMTGSPPIITTHRKDPSICGSATVHTVAVFDRTIWDRTT